MRTFGFMLAAAVATTLTLAAAAAPAAYAADGVVTWKGLDLGTDAGRSELNSRIDSAARNICTPVATTGSRIARTSPRCFADAQAAIRAKLATKLPATALAVPSNSGALASAGDK